MALEDVKAKLKEQLKELAARVQETTAWMQLSEKYQNLSPNAQRLSLVGTGVVVLMILLSPPIYYYLSSNSLEAEFEDKQDLIRQVYRVSRQASQIPLPPSSLTTYDLESRARDVLTSERLQPEQIIGVTPLEKQKGPGLPASLSQSGVRVSLSKLTLYQIVDIGARLQSLHPLARMLSLDIKADTSPENYFDAIFEIVTFSASTPGLASAAASQSDTAKANAIGNRNRFESNTSGIPRRRGGSPTKSDSTSDLNRDGN